MIRRSGDWLSARVGGEIMMMSAERGNYLGINEVGAQIWEMLETPSDMEAICTTLIGEYDVTPAACRQEVEQFLARMEEHGAVAIDPA